ncbi:amidohydrolase [Purpureocillium lavendulum]|uniref:Amidohydrolase n=1 Tax=Purpureocillium lavendulum TaxID=1247861 RepID=A0AB34FVF0_9HYPO|nr:amidohydrolase [Purpureocillium lavendulum]
MVTEVDLKPWLREPPRRYILAHATVVDVANGTLRENTAVKLQDGKIQSITTSDDVAIDEARQQGFKVVDCRDKFLSPGLIDCHVHITAVSGSDKLTELVTSSADISLLRQPYACAQMLYRGFTTVRDCGGALAPLKEAIEDGVFPGPRLFIAGHVLSQSGGHGDFRGRHDHSLCCGGSTSTIGRIVNGVPECLMGAREEIRTGADFIKIMAGGGVASPTDSIDHVQFTKAEIQAVVEVADNVGTYVTAHAYTPKAIRQCVESGVRGIEHGNLIDAPTAKLLAETGTYLTPTLVTYAQMASEKWARFLPPSSARKNREVLDAGLAALKTAHDAGVAICFGTDLLGPLGTAQTSEFKIRSQVLSSLAILKSATITPAQMFGRAESLGQVKDGFVADILITSKNPLEDITIFDEPENVLAVIKEGRVYKSRWDGLIEDADIPVRLKPEVSS